MDSNIRSVLQNLNEGDGVKLKMSRRDKKEIDKLIQRKAKGFLKDERFLEEINWHNLVSNWDSVNGQLEEFKVMRILINFGINRYFDSLDSDDISLKIKLESSITTLGKYKNSRDDLDNHQLDNYEFYSALKRIFADHQELIFEEHAVSDKEELKDIAVRATKSWIENPTKKSNFQADVLEIVRKEY